MSAAASTAKTPTTDLAVDFGDEKKFADSLKDIQEKWGAGAKILFVKNGEEFFARKCVKSQESRLERTKAWFQRLMGYKPRFDNNHAGKKLTDLLKDEGALAEKMNTGLFRKKQELEVQTFQASIVRHRYQTVDKQLRDCTGSVNTPTLLGKLRGELEKCWWDTDLRAPQSVQKARETYDHIEAKLDILEQYAKAYEQGGSVGSTKKLLAKVIKNLESNKLTEAKECLKSAQEALLLEQRLTERTREIDRRQQGRPFDTYVADLQADTEDAIEKLGDSSLRQEEMDTRKDESNELTSRIGELTKQLQQLQHQSNATGPVKTFLSRAASLIANAETEIARDEKAADDCLKDAASSLQLARELAKHLPSSQAQRKEISKEKLNSVLERVEKEFASQVKNAADHKVPTKGQLKRDEVLAKTLRKIKDELLSVTPEHKEEKVSADWDNISDKMHQLRVAQGMRKNRLLMEVKTGFGEIIATLGGNKTGSLQKELNMD